MTEKEKNMNDEKDFQDTEMDEEDMNIITLTDDEGNEVDFEFIDLVEYEGKEYVVLLPVEGDEEEQEQVVIYEVVPCDDDTEMYKGIDSEAVLNAVFEIFKERNKDLFNFED
jgi:uncharacterized protein YrzB (UPF0473 family)